MSGPRYLLRFDDICPGMNWEVWAQIEELLQAHRVKPMLAVVPDNRDPSLDVASRRADFWNRVRLWQSRGWSVGLHGYQHVYTTRSAGLLGVNARSEFAGLSAAEQAGKLDAAIGIFGREGVRVDCWIAPGHSFDAETVRLLRKRGVTVISDGYYRWPVRWLGCTWVPQQLWRFRPMPSGVWTVCYHHNGFGAQHVARLAADLKQYSSQITSIEEVLGEAVRERTMGDAWQSAVWLAAIKARRVLARLTPCPCGMEGDGTRA